MKKMIDSHCHLQQLSQSALVSTFESSLKILICNSTSQSDWQDVLNLGSNQVIPCIGIHPWYLNSATGEWEEQMRNLVCRDGVHVGEIGLDNCKSKLCPKPVQEDFFRKQLRMAVEFHKVANIHCVSAYGKMLTILKQEVPGGDLKVLLHSWEGPWEVTKEMLDHFGQNIVFSLSMASLNKEKQRKVAFQIPLDNIMIETDSPSQAVASFLTTEPDVELINGKPVNKPWYLKHVFHQLREMKSIGEDELLETLNNNFYRIFR
jgi:TatD DNase family protein